MSSTANSAADLSQCTEELSNSWLPEPPAPTNALCAKPAEEGSGSEESNPEDDFDDEDAETTLFDLYLTDNYQGLILASFTDHWLKIPAPKDAVEQFPKLLNEQAVLRLLSGKIKNGERKVLGVGSVRVSLETFRIIVRLEGDMLASQASKLKPTRIGEPETGLSFRQDLRTTYAGTFQEDFTGAVNHRTIASIGKYWTDIDGTFVQDEDYELDNLAGFGIVGDSRIGFGYLRTPGERFAGSVDFVGISAETAQETFLDEESLRGSRFEIFVPGRSRVDFYRGGRLIDTQALEFGLQMVDTSRFPQGSYNIEIVITENNGGTTRENRFFTKSGQLSITDYPIYNLQLGYLRDRLKVEDVPVYEAGLTYRLLSFLQVSASAYGTDDITIGSGELKGLFHDIYFSAGAAQSTEGNTGLSGDLTGNIFGFNLGAFYSGTINTSDTSLDNGNHGSADDSEDPLHPTIGPLVTTLQEEQKLNNIALSRQNLTAYIFKNFGSFEFRFIGNKNRDERDMERYAWGPVATWRIVEKRKDVLRLELSYLKTEEGDRPNLFLGYTHRFDPWMASAQLNSGKRSSKSENRLAEILDYDTKTRAGEGTRGRVTNENLDSEDNLSTTNSLEIRHVAKHVDSAVFLRDQRGASENTNLGANVDISFLRGNQGGFALSYPAEGDAVLIAEIESQTAQKAQMLLFINGTEYGTIQYGSRLVVGLPPYKSYKVFIKPAEGTDLVDYDATTTEFTFFPGNAITKSWRVEHVFIAIGKIVDKTGKAIPHARLKGFKGYVATEEDGSFQADSNGNETLEIDDEIRHCRISLPAISTPEYYYEYGSLTCE